MLLVSQFPLCDLRAFSPTGPARLRLPLWPQPDPAVTFVRHFGSVERRRRGGHDYWPDEAYFCSSRHALKFPNLDTTRLGRVAAGNGSPRSALIPRCAFRRLLCDGKAVVRVEVGLTNQSRLRSKPNVQFDGHSCLALVADFLSMPAQVTSFSG